MFGPNQLTSFKLINRKILSREYVDIVRSEYTVLVFIFSSNSILIIMVQNRDALLKQWFV